MKISLPSAVNVLKRVHGFAAKSVHFIPSLRLITRVLRGGFDTLNITPSLHPSAVQYFARPLIHLAARVFPKRISHLQFHTVNTPT